MRACALEGRPDQGELVAVGASQPFTDEVPHLAGIVTRGDLRGQGLGRLVTESLTLTEVQRSGVCTLGMYSDNDAASQLYGGLGATPLEQQVALQEMDDLLGMDNGAETDLPGLNPTSVDDQLRLLAALQDPPEGLDADDVSTVTELMAVPAPGRQTPDESKDFGVGSLSLIHISEPTRRS